MASITLSRGEVAILDTIRRRDRVTRSDVAAAVGLGPAMAARLVARLQEAGLVRDAGGVASGGRGRQATLLEIQPDAAYVVGVDIGTDVIHLLAADLHGATRAYREVPSELLADKPQGKIVAALATLIHDTICDAAIAASRVAVVGVSITGIIDGERGLCLARSNTPGWEDFPLRDHLGQTVHLPVVLEETARAKSVAEAHCGAARGVRYFLYVDVGTAIGAGIVIDGQPLRGVAGLAGEIGHVTVDPEGPLCRCGNRGCIQASASARALVAQARELLRRGVFSSLSSVGDALTLADIAAAAAAGDKMALGLLTGAGERLGEAISLALNLLGFDHVVMGGAVAQCSPVVLEAAERSVRLRLLPIVPRPLVLACSALGRDAAARGVVLQAIDWLFEDPAARILSHAGGEIATGREQEPITAVS